jgi:UDP-2-acetamido-3-amino-2,3-dideoxy-glucuronate N-acetyltransferase
MTSYIHPSSVIDDGCNIGHGVRIWHFCHLMPGCTIGDGCVIGQNVFIASNVVLGKNVHVQNNVSLYEGVSCEDDVFLGPSMVFTNIKNPRSAISRKGQYMNTVIGKGATIGANATIVCGNNIGRYALIGAGAVVTKPVPPFALIAGNPARQTGWVSEAGLRLEFDDEGCAVCSEDGSQYRLSKGSVIKLEE